ncbi:Stabilin-2 [Dactylellina cionopaga]|nr:Stabilin-2 [Dactylellina cionopaga]
MRSNIITAALLAASAVNAQTFLEAIQKQPELSIFSTIIASLNNTFMDLLSAADLHTVLVPNNKAISAYMQKNDIKSPADIQVDKVLPFLSYHILLNNISSELFAAPGGGVVETKLKSEDYALLKNNSGQVIYGTKTPHVEAPQDKADAISIKSGLGEMVNIVKSDLTYNRGLLHIVDGFLTLPSNCSKTIALRGAERLVTYIKRVDLLDALDGTPGATCFAPSDAAIDAAAPVLMNMTDAELLDAIKFHILLDPYYTTDLKDGQKIDTALPGKAVTVNVVSGDYYFNGIRAKTTNDIARNGVAYVLDGIMPYEFDGTVKIVSSTSSGSPTSTVESTSTGTAAVTTTSAAGTGSDATGTTSAPTGTTTPNSASAIRVGCLSLVAGFTALMALF